jgi:hypothetical protein
MTPFSFLSYINLLKLYILFVCSNFFFPTQIVKLQKVKRYSVKPHALSLCFPVVNICYICTAVFSKSWLARVRASMVCLFLLLFLWKEGGKNKMKGKKSSNDVLKAKI